ncbi:recombinase family protein [Amycolatopsis sp. K13G38]|uniref:Recombinase family protein n=1 Tax=Amycolatopsis acididurans TaxID=2724524 RepID=A0ABX1JG73_9PSEU|nr:recombinase family protein [Amycolatopsis acididurans]NKQ58743.1 recombinase family protein [Amycolatopsis acididurans]
MNGEGKITRVHRDRLAVVYLRQSSMVQVREHTESTTRQYGLAEEAVRLGWARQDVVVIDTDLGVSGRWGVARAGFTELVGRVCSGEVGAIFGIEISRLARSNAEVARLMEFAAITETLLIDADGVYDPADVNDRMLLGMKSTIGEVELHVMAQRLHAAKNAAAQRGELRTPLPVGLVYDEAGDVVIDPDAEVQAAIRDVFAAFEQTGSAYGVVAAFATRRFPLRAYGGVWAGQLRWGKLTHARVLGVLKNPGYAGAYVHGRYTSRRRVDPDGTVHTGLVERPRAEWPVLIKDHHPGYITWEQFLLNEAKLAANRTNAGARPPREGSALCQGIIACGSCGKPMRTNYHTDARPSYECSSRADRLTTPTCRSVAASTVDDAVAEQLLAALNPTEVALALAAADRVTDRHQRVSRAAELAVERARYDAERAERAFHAVEPENRLVARSLEARWEAKLATLAEAEQALAAATDTLPPLPGRAELEQLAADLPGLWHAPTTSNKDRKRLLRTLIADITLLPETDHDKVAIGIRWHTGATDELRVARAVHPGTAKRSPSPAVEMVTRLGPTTPTAELANILNAAGLTTGHGRPFDVKAVQWIRHAYHIPAPVAYAEGEISVAQAAERLGCSTGVIYYWINTGQLDAHRGSGHRLCIPWNGQIQHACNRRIIESGHLNPAARRSKPRTRR